MSPAPRDYVHGDAAPLMQPTSLTALWQDVVTTYERRNAVVDGAGASTFAEIERASTQLAIRLDAQGVRERRVAILCPADRRFAVALLAVWKLGGTVVPLTPLHPTELHRQHCSSARVDVLLTTAEHRSSAMALGVEILDLGPLVTRDVETDEDENTAMAKASVDRRPDDIALLLFTSGTTGRPKAAALSDANVTALARLLQSAWELDHEDRLVHALPLHHLHGLGIAFLPTLFSGGATHFMGSFDAIAVWNAFSEGTVFMAVPTMHQKLFDAFDRAKDETQARWRDAAKKLRLVTSGSAKLPDTLGERWNRLTGSLPLERFGMTEVGVTLSHPLRGERRSGSCGVALPGMEVRLVANGSDVPLPAAGEDRSAPGELWFRGPTVFAGYDGDPAATEEAFTDGWFRSGDTAAWLPGGYVRILGRTSVDIIKSGGYKISALEIEEALRSHPSVEDAAVVGVPDPMWGERIVAALISRDEIGEEDLRAYLRDRIATYQIPKEFHSLDELPRNALGKVTKMALIERFRGESS